MAGERDAVFEDLFSDPLILMLMESDRIAEDDARKLFSEVAERIRRRRLGTRSDFERRCRDLRTEHCAA